MPLELPAGYHVNNFTRLLDSVFNQFQDLLTNEEIRLYQGFKALNEDAKSLYVRLLCRRNRLFRSSKLNYPDIECLPKAINQLAKKRLITVNPTLNADAALSLYTKKEIIVKFNISGKIKQAPISEIVQFLQEMHPAEYIQLKLQQDEVLQTEFEDAFETYKCCFFGNSHQDLSEFVITELGHVTYEQYPLDKHSRYFQCREEIDSQLAYNRAQAQLDKLEYKLSSTLLLDTATNLPKPNAHRGLQRRHHRVVIAIGRQLERLKAYDAALAVYRLTPKHPSGERQIRILTKIGKSSSAWQLCLQLNQSSNNIEELEYLYSAARKLRKALKKPPQTVGTEPLPQHNIPQQMLELRKSDTTVERCVAEHFNNQGLQCFYVENALFCGLFGLFLWDIIFSPITGAFINPFQRAPLDISGADFYDARQTAIENRLRLLQGDQWKPIIREHYKSKHSIANRFVHWGILNESLLETSLNHIPATHLAIIFRQIALNPNQYGSGLPDLICYCDDRYRLLEVKAPGDRLQSNQARWFKTFLKHQIPAGLIHVSWSTSDE